MGESIVTVQDARSDPSDQIPSNENFSRWALLPLAGENRSGGLTIRIVDEEEIQHLNRDYRKQDKVTNVLSFSYADHPEGYIGDVVICAPIVLREASEQGLSNDHHWAHLVVHGVLHLLGYDHESEVEAEQMESKEIALLSQLGIANPYIVDNASWR